MQGCRGVLRRAAPSALSTHPSAALGLQPSNPLPAARLASCLLQKRGRVDLQVPGPKPPRQAGAAWDPRFGAWTFPFMGADASVIRRSMAALVKAGEPAANVSVVFTLPSKYYMTLWQVDERWRGWAVIRITSALRGGLAGLPDNAFLKSGSAGHRCAWSLQPLPAWPARYPQGFGAAFAYLAGRPWGRSLLLKYPRLFRWVGLGGAGRGGAPSRRIGSGPLRWASLWLSCVACSHLGLPWTAPTPDRLPPPLPGRSYGLFTHEGPSEQQMAETGFSFTNIGRGYSQGAPACALLGGQAPSLHVAGRTALRQGCGWGQVAGCLALHAPRSAPHAVLLPSALPTCAGAPSEPGQAPDLEVVTRVSGPEPGYIACSVFIVQARSHLAAGAARCQCGRDRAQACKLHACGSWGWRAGAGCPLLHPPTPYPSHRPLLPAASGRHHAAGGAGGAAGARGAHARQPAARHALHPAPAPARHHF